MTLEDKMAALFKEYGHEWEKEPGEIHPWLYRGRDFLHRHRIEELETALREATDVLESEFTGRGGRDLSGGLVPRLHALLTPAS